VIAGGGPSGCATALFLWHAAPELAKRVLVIDKAEFPREKICAGAIGARADKLLAEIGVDVRVPSATVWGMGVATRGGELRVRRETPVGRVVRRVEFDAALLDEVRARGIEVRTGVTLTGIEREGGGVRVATSAGEIRARALVGADGVQSATRRLCGFARGEYHAQVVEVDVPPLAGDDEDLLWFDLRDASYAGYGWTFPTPVGGGLMMSRGIYQLTRGGPATSTSDVGALLAAELDRCGAPREGLRFKRFAERGLARGEACAVDRVLLVGEAAGIDPALGEGIAQAIFYGKTAGEYLARAGGDYQFTDWGRVLGRSRVGVDLALRAAGVAWVYGARRAWTERLLSSSRSFALAGMSYFAGERLPLGHVTRAAVDMLRVL
jgi:menaquinone-9 beta-reductase